jgi:hypothetical protein
LKIGNFRILGIFFFARRADLCSFHFTLHTIVVRTVLNWTSLFMCEYIFNFYRYTTANRKSCTVLFYGIGILESICINRSVVAS